MESVCGRNGTPDRGHRQESRADLGSLLHQGLLQLRLVNASALRGRVERKERAKVRIWGRNPCLESGSKGDLILETPERSAWVLIMMTGCRQVEQEECQAKCHWM